MPRNRCPPLRDFISGGGDDPQLDTLVLDAEAVCQELGLEKEDYDEATSKPLKA